MFIEETDLPEMGLDFVGGELVPQEIDLMEEIEVDDGKHFSENLAGKLSPELLQKLSNHVLKNIQEDIDSRSSWEESYSRGFQLLGTFKDPEETEDSTLCYIFDPILANCLFDSYAKIMPNIFPPEIFQYKINGPADEKICSSAYKIKELINDYLNNKDKGYRKDSKKLCLYFSMFGCIFRKVYQDPVTNLPKSRFIKPQNFIVNNGAVSIEEADHYTEVVYFTKRDILLRKRDGSFIESKFPSETSEEEDNSPISVAIKKLDNITDDSENSTTFRYYIHDCYLGDEYLEALLGEEDDGIPKAFALTICNQTREIVEIKRKWEPTDPNYNRIDNIVGYEYLPGFGFYGFGILHLLGNNAKALTMMRRQYINAISFSIMQAGFIADFKQENNNITLQPGKFYTLKSLAGFSRIQDSIMSLPFQQPNMAMHESIKELYSVSGLSVGSANSVPAELGRNAAEGTVLAIFEKQDEKHSVVVHSLVDSLREEGNLLLKLFKRSFSDEPYMLYSGNSMIQISKEDFNERISLVPTCQPSLSTAAQRIRKNDAMLKLAASAPPGMYNLRQLHINMAESLEIGDIENIFLPENGPPEMDAVTENMMAFKGQPLKAYQDQDHGSHITNHAYGITQNPESEPILRAHIQEHAALAYKNMIIGAIQMPIGDDGVMSPEIQNQISIKAAQFTENLMQSIQHKQQAEDPALITARAMEQDVQQKAIANSLKAESDDKKTEAQVLIKELEFELENNKLAQQMQIAREKNETELENTLIKEGMKNA